MWDNSTITDAGSLLLSRWAGGGTLTITGAAAGTGCVDVVALAKQTALLKQKQTAPIVNYAANANGIQYTIRLTAADEGYIANQIGIFAKLDNGAETLIAIYQDETGIPIPDKSEMPDFLYAFYATIQMNNGPINVLIDPNASISREDAIEIINSSSLRVDAAQALTDAQKQQARENMGLAVDSALSSTSANPVQNKVVNEALNGKAPTSHRSTGTTYGAANASYYGHVKLSDSTSSTSGASSGVAATPAAVKAVYDLASGKAPSSHDHSASNITSGTMPVERGGTGATTVPGARTNLGIPNPTTSDSGKFLRVNSSGAYVLETVTAAEGVSF